MFILFRLIKRVVSALVLFVFISVGATAGYVGFKAYSDDRTPTDAILVLGAAQFDGRPSPVLRNRLDQAITLYQEQVAKRIVTVGGSQPGDRYTEATAGRMYLRDHGIPSSAIKAIRKGDDTFNSVAAVAVWAQANGIGSFTVVTDPCHSARAAAMVKSYGFAVHTAPPHTGPGSDITWRYVLRETGGLLRYWLFKDSDFSL